MDRQDPSQAHPLLVAAWRIAGAVLGVMVVTAALAGLAYALGRWA